MSLWGTFLAWRQHRHQRAVLRRLAKLDARIESASASLEESRARHNVCTTISNFDIHRMAELAGKVAYLKRIRAHNFQHEDVL